MFNVFNLEQHLVQLELLRYSSSTNIHKNENSHMFSQKHFQTLILIMHRVMNTVFLFVCVQACI